MSLPVGEAQLGREALGGAVLYEFASLMRGHAEAGQVASDLMAEASDLKVEANRVRKEIITVAESNTHELGYTALGELQRPSPEVMPQMKHYFDTYASARARRAEAEIAKGSLVNRATQLESAWPIGDIVEVTSLIKDGILRLRDSQTGLATTGKGAKTSVQGTLEEVQLSTGYGGAIRVRDRRNRLFSVFPLISPRDFQARHEVRFLG